LFFSSYLLFRSGLLLDLIECEPIYFQAVEITAGSRLLFHVVSDDRVALKIMKQFNKDNLPGECNFFPVNRIVAPPRKEYQDADGRAILDVFDYDEYYDAVFRNVFAGTAIVRDLHLGARFARSEGFDCVTLDGDQISRRGALTGGYIDTKKSKLELHKNIRAQQMNRDQLQMTLGEIQRKVNEKMSAVEKIQMEIDKVDNDLRVYKQQHRNLTERSVMQVNNCMPWGEIVSQRYNKGQLLNLRNRVRELRAQLEGYQAQIGSEFLSQLSRNEQAECERLQREILERKQKLDQVSKERSALETTKQKLENQLTTNLLRKRDSLNAKISDIAVDEKRHNLQAESAELNSVIQRLNEIVRRIAELDESLTEYDESAEKLNRELEDVQEQQKDLEAQLADFSKQADIIFTKQSTLQSKREESVKKIRELGSLPTDAFSKYQGLS
ncbi:SMC protein Flexible Hinge domain protein, partial [Oesophagostomum dentatum]